jgi:hypothetical protein
MSSGAFFLTFVANASRMTVKWKSNNDDDLTSQGTTYLHLEAENRPKVLDKYARHVPLYYMPVLVNMFVGSRGKFYQTQV